MMMIRRSVILLALLLAACNLSVPDVTPTIAPTRTPSPTLIVSNTPQPTIVAQVATSTPSSTATVTATFFVLPSDTFVPPTITRTNQPTTTSSVTPTLTLTSTPSLTATLTNTPTQTLTNAPSATSSFTPTKTATSTPLPTATPTLPSTETLVPSPTPLPLVPTDIPTLTPSLTLTLTPSATFTNEPTATPTFTPSNTPRPLPTATRTLSPEELATFATVIAPVGVPPTPTQGEVALAPTLDVTPTYITAEAPIIETPLVTPLPAEGTPQEVLSTPTAQPTVSLIVTLPGIVTAIPIAPISFNPPSQPNRVFGLSTSGGVTGGGFSLLNDTVLFERNPVDPNLYVTTDSSGNMYLTGVNGAGASRPDMSPFSSFIALNRDENNAFVPAAKWSPDGRFLAFIVAGKKTGNDGVWFFQPGQFPPVQLLVDCLPINVPGCSLVS
ncbi:MAG: hypothetical protein H0X30_38325, partial [Anaerolineae bacterium]|nr:hypothetical protein [Anaerolineae bacterium]